MSGVVKTFKIEKILKCCKDKNGNNTIYYIKWEGYDSTYNTWENESDIFMKNPYLLLQFHGKNNNNINNNVLLYNSKRMDNESDFKDDNNQSNRSTYFELNSENKSISSDNNIETRYFGRNSIVNVCYIMYNILGV